MNTQSLEAFYSKFNEVIGTLVHAYESLLVLLIEERNHLVSSSLLKLKKNNQKKENIILHIQFLEEKRKSNIRDFLKSFKVYKKNMTFNHLIPYFDPIGKKENLNQIYIRFKNLVEDVKRKNEHNKKLIRLALNHSAGALNEIKGFFYGLSTYEKEGRIKKGGISSGRIISKEI